MKQDKQKPTFKFRFRAYATLQVVESLQGYLPKVFLACDAESPEYYFKQVVGDDDEGNKLWDRYAKRLKDVYTSVEKTKRVWLLSTIKAMVILPLLAAAGFWFYHIIFVQGSFLFPAIKDWWANPARNPFGLGGDLTGVNKLLMIFLGALVHSCAVGMFALEIAVLLVGVFLGPIICNELLDIMLVKLLFKEEMQSLQDIDFIGDELSNHLPKIKATSSSEMETAEDATKTYNDDIAREDNRRKFIDRVKHALPEADDVSITFC